ncbi:DUF3037 domain-containing protein [Rhodococcus hoagii]|nr:DUF3037 domain-containing protein [Prescottella equi]
MRYNYWTLRYLPDAVRGEFVNIGLIVGRDGADWSMRSIESFNRASRLGGDLSVAHSWIKTLRSTFASANSGDYLTRVGSGVSEDWIVRLRGFHNNCVQISEPLPVVASSANEAVDLLFDRLVVEPVQQKRNTSRGHALTALRNAYLRQFDEEALLSRVRVRSGRQGMDFDFALTNDSIEELSKVWTFDKKDLNRQVDQVQAWGFRVEELRNHGGELETDRRAYEVPSDVPVKVLFVPPRTDEGHETLAIARDAWTRIDATALPITQARELVLA